MEDAWTEWAGGTCPVDGLDVVEVRFRNGETCTGVQAGEEVGYEIVAYRLDS